MENKEKWYISGIGNNGVNPDLDITGCKNLASAIIRAHIIDYREVYNMYIRGKRGIRSLENERAIFHSDWFKFLFLCLGFEADDESIDYYIEKIEGRK